MMKATKTLFIVVACYVVGSTIMVAPFPAWFKLILMLYFSFLFGLTLYELVTGKKI